MRYETFDFNSIVPIKTWSLNFLKENIEKLFIIDIRNGKLRLPGAFSRNDFIVKNNLIELLNNLWFYTKFLNNNTHYKQRMWHVLNNIFVLPICPKCLNNHNKFGTENYNLYCSQNCANRSTSTGRIRSLETKIKIGQAHKNKVVTDNTKTKQSISAKISMDKKKQTKLKKYGDEHYCNSEQANVTKIKNNSFSTGIGIIGQTFFEELFLQTKELPIENFIYGKTDKNKKIIQREYVVYNSENKKVRLLDCYIKLKNQKEINIEFNEPKHYSSKQISLDEIRDMDIKTAKPNIIILKVRQTDYLKNKQVAVQNIIQEIKRYI